MTIAQPASVWSPGRAGQARPFEDYCAADPSRPPAQWIYDRPSIGFVISGWFEYASEGASILAGPGALILGNAGEPFSVRHADPSGNRRLVVTLNEDVIEDVSNHAGIRPRFGASVIPPGSSATYAGSLIRAISKGDNDAQFSLAEAALRAFQPSLPERITALDRSRIYQAMRYIDARFDQPCSLRSLAGVAGLSRYHFVRTFGRIVGVTPNQYLINVRIRAAADLLTTTKMPIAEVVFAVGFNDISYFYSCFRGTFRCTPRQWRARS